MSRFFIDKITSDSEHMFYFVKPIQTSYCDLKNSNNDVSIYRLIVIPKDCGYIDIYDNQV